MINFSKEVYQLALNYFTSINKIIFMVSGGIDSIAGSYYFFNRNLSDKNVLYHFNHKLREQNDSMQRMIEYYHRENSGLFNLDIGIAESGIKTEDECRKLRFDYLDNKYTNSLIITAHHLDDCVESYLMNCFRGKEGYLPIPFITKTNNNLIVHPFLFTRKSDFYSLVKTSNLSKFVVEDETNSMTKGSRRNFIRTNIVPLLEQEKMGLSTIVKKKMKTRLDLLIKKSVDKKEALC